MITNNYSIPESNLDKLMKIANKLNQRARKLHQPEIVITTDGTQMKLVAGTLGEYRKYYNITISGQTPSIGDWNFVAKLDHTEKGNVIRSLASVPEEFKNTSGTRCDHCSVAHQRKVSYVVEKDAIYKQVGGSCVHDFLGLANIQDVAGLLESWFEMQEILDSEPDEEFSKYGGGYYGYKTVDVIALAINVIKTWGWMSKSTAAQQMKASTADRVQDLLNKLSPVEDDINEAKEIIKSVIEWTDGSWQNEYKWNLNILMQQEFVEYKNFGYVVSAVNFYNTEKAHRTASENSGEFIGTVGEKVTFKIAKISIKILDGAYGKTYLNKMEDENGNHITWFASNMILREDSIGDTVTGTVKCQEIYNGQKQTIVTRCKVK